MLKKIAIGIGVFIVLILILAFAFGDYKEEPTSATPTESPGEPKAKQPEKQEETWNEVLFDIAEWDKNNGETKTREFRIESEKWRIQWGKRKLAALSIKVFTSDNKLFGDGFVAELGEPTEGVLNFTGSGAYYILLVQSTNPDAGVSDIRVEELK